MFGWMWEKRQLGCRTPKRPASEGGPYDSGHPKSGQGFDGGERVAAFAPGVEAALERADAGDALFSEEQRHTGAGGFVWSSTVENHFAVAGQPFVFLLQLLGVHAESAGDGFRLGFEIHVVAEIDDDKFFAGVNLFFQFLDADAGNAQVAEEFLSHPIGKMNTIRNPHWTDGISSVLIGDAAHAIVPFHGQGMNCAFEDCVELDQLLQHHSFAAAGKLFEQQRKPNTDAIADMALENYVEMRDTVRQPKFALQKELAFELERRFPTQFIPRYSMD